VCPCPPLNTFQRQSSWMALTTVRQISSDLTSRRMRLKTVILALNKLAKTMLSQGNRAMQRVFSYTQLLFDCYLLQVPIGQCQNTTDLTTDLTVWYSRVIFKTAATWRTSVFRWLWQKIVNGCMLLRPAIWWSHELRLLSVSGPSRLVPYL